MTVSVVLNGATSSTRVSEATRTRIQDVATRLRYRPNGVARGLSRRRMDTIGVIACTEGSELNLYFLEVLNGILAATAQLGQNTTVFSVSDWQADETKMLQFCDGRVDGLVLIGPMISTAFAKTLHDHIPFIAIHSNVHLPYAHNLEVDDEAGAHAIVEYLFSQGHRRILHFAAEPNLSGAQRRLAGYRRALEEAGITYDSSLVVPGEFNSASGQARMIAWLDQRRPMPFPTALFCANDAIAYGCMEVLADRGIRVPEDFSIVGFDDTLNARMTLPPLTTVRQPFRQMGQSAVETLLSQISGETTVVEQAEIEIFDVEVIVRKSVGPPAQSVSPLQDQRH